MQENVQTHPTFAPTVELCSLDDLFQQLYDPLLYFANTFVNDLETSEELVSDAFIAYWTKKEDFNNYNQIKSFLYVCTKNACLNHLRKQKQSPIPHSLEEVEHMLQDDRDLLAEIIKTELLELIQYKMKQLPEKQREVFRLSFYESLSHEEISEKLDISIDAVYLHKSRALTFLKKNMRFEYLVLLSLFGQ